MYTATMRYCFKPDSFEDACRIWKEKVMTFASQHPGFLRMQLLEKKEEGIALAIGTWKTKEDAQNFMKTGVFKELMQKLKDVSLKQPQPEIWNLKFYQD